MSTSSPEVSDDAVRAATGRDWAQWRALLDARGGAALPHAALARLLIEEGLVSDAWWAQTVTVGYERLIGRRAVGQVDGGYQVGVQRTLPLAPAEAWALLCSPAGLSAWLAEGATRPASAGEGGVGTDGTRYAVRSMVEGQRLRLRWQPPGRPAATTLQVLLEPRRSGTAVRFLHEGLADVAERTAMRARWEAALARLAALAAVR